MPPRIDKISCTSCGICIDRCPEDVYANTPSGIPLVKYPDECWYCGSCVVDCPSDAVKLYIPLAMQVSVAE
ncbi:MAG: ferredoxin family protein [Chloroflexi bacterium]|nr:ferredoxin family protein [Chloroflexota bacterium]